METPSTCEGPALGPTAEQVTGGLGGLCGDLEQHRTCAQRAEPPGGKKHCTGAERAAAPVQGPLGLI